MVKVVLSMQLGALSQEASHLHVFVLNICKKKK